MSGTGQLVGRSGEGYSSTQAAREAKGLERARPFRWLVRAGFVARGLTYGVVGGLALALALGAGTLGTTPNQEGALALIARTPVGRPALLLLSAGLLAYALWKLTQGIFGYGPEGGGSRDLKDRVGNVAGGLVYVGFFAVAVAVLAGSSGNSSAGPRKATSGVLGWPGGTVIVGAAGVILIGISLYQLYDAVRGGFLDDIKGERMDSSVRRLYATLGRIGLSARALVFALIGYFVLRTAIDYNPADAIGLDGALARLHHQPFGPWLVGLTAAGLLTFAASSLFEARYRRL
ncbi:MAG TPA: DUF1206 domain-containing protein [Solirubrobacteraceae bacterium]|nr:DUF1206 domain-containing protein [Solirubrobacteraceae bacterium]